MAVLMDTINNVSPMQKSPGRPGNAHIGPGSPALRVGPNPMFYTSCYDTSHRMRLFISGANDGSQCKRLDIEKWMCLCIQPLSSIYIYIYICVCPPCMSTTYMYVYIYPLNIFSIYMYTDPLYVLI